MNSFRIPEIAKQYTHYDMIQSYTDLPDFPEFRTRLLFAFLNRNANLNKTTGELFALVTSLVQMGLDTHEMVAVSNDLKEKKEARSRQLKVLAGDYFSSRFYNLLSQAGQIELIQQLSNAICEVNRLKMNLYMKMKQLKVTSEEYILHTVDIKSQLFIAFSQWMGDVYTHAWPEILKSFTRCEVILEEIFRAESLDGFQESWSFWHIWQNGSKEERKQLQASDPDDMKIRTLMHKYNITSQLYQMLDSHLQQLHVKVEQLDSDKLINELYHIGEPFLKFMSKPKVLEEI